SSTGARSVPARPEPGPRPGGLAGFHRLWVAIRRRDSDYPEQQRISCHAVGELCRARCKRAVLFPIDVAITSPDVRSEGKVPAASPVIVRLGLRATTKHRDAQED